ncbi:MULTISPECIES: hypothetical protein [unclassified Nocardiopsis]|uniref:hypothetical protein n=1 Tax=unclassified Nocardiopsis TaxID=2649073 RepID=UPI0033CBF431
MTQDRSEHVFRIGFTVLDRQVVDRHGENLGKVDDVEFTWQPGRAPAMTALVVDAASLGGRLAGRLGRSWEAVLKRLRPLDHSPTTVAVSDVEEFTPTTVLSTRAPTGGRPVEDWIARNVIARVPGGTR